MFNQRKFSYILCSRLLQLTKSTHGDGDAKKPRLWSQDDEIVVLQGILHFSKDTQTDPTRDIASFFHSIIKSLHFPATLTQFKDKLMRLKRKFNHHAHKDMAFSNTHSQKTFNLSKQIWGAQGCIISVNPKKMSASELVMNVGNKPDFKTLPFLNIGLTQMGDYVVMKALKMLHTHEKAHLQAKLRKLHAADLQLFIDRLQFLKEHAQLIIASYND
ncbi:probable transcription factor At1g61730 [Mercurialis annua]|uniref:probable transcription factor At1g61730 n=1 Tax=Mercurialis annua TaxID=3986 RepID=UPI00215E8F29|nr:probable transcription factor At1g61730 [Mercurialis annua]